MLFNEVKIADVRLSLDKQNDYYLDKCDMIMNGVGPFLYGI